MNKIRQWLYYTFGMSRVEANGLVIFLPLVLFLVFLPSIVRELTYTKIDLQENTSKLDSLIAQIQLVQPALNQQVYTLRNFDPNTVSTETLHGMGLSSQVVRNWIKYLEKGGKFYKPEDIKRIYGLSDSMANVLTPYVVLEKTDESGVRPSKERIVAYRKPSFTESKPPIKPFDLNLADTTLLKKVRGIGPVLSSRIVKYRELLGGFVRKEQLKEVYGLKDSVIAHLDTLTFIGEGQSRRFISINSFSAREMSRHPYLSTREAAAIVNYRRQHGPYQELKDLYNIHMLDSLTIFKLTPYLQF